MTEEMVLKSIDLAGVITWWPGCASHNAICSLRDSGAVVLRDCSLSQESIFEVRRAPKH